MADEIRIKAVLDLSAFNPALKALNAGLSAVGGALREVGVGALRYIGELLVRSFTEAGRAVARLASDVFKAASENARFRSSLEQARTSLVDITRTNLTPLFDQFDQLIQKAGPAFLGVVQRGEEYLGGLAQRALGWGEGLVNSFAQGIWDGIGAVVDALTAVANVITFWLKPGSPPRLLPNIDEWGRAAMNEFLNGFGSADFDVFKTISTGLTSLIRSLPMPKGGGVDVISRILGTREGIAKAVDELRRAGAVSSATLDSITAQVGTADETVRAYIQSVIKAQAANSAVADAQKKLTAATKAYDDLLKPLNDKLAGLSEAEQQLDEDQEKRALQLVLKDPNATASEKRRAQLRLEEIDAERAQRAVEAQGKAAVDAAQTQLDTAKEAQTVAQDQLDADKGRLDYLTETNALLAEQARLLEQVSKPTPAPAGGAPAAVGLQVDTSWIDNLLDNLNEKLEPLKTAWADAWAAMSTAMQPARDAWDGDVKPAWERLVKAFQDKAPEIQAEIGHVTAFAVTNLGITLPGVFANLGHSLDSLAGIWERHGSTIIQVVGFAFRFAITFITTTMLLISGVVAAALRLLEGSFDTWGLAFQGDWAGVWENVKTTLADAWQIVSDTLTVSLEGILSLAGTDLETFKKTWGDIFDKIGVIVTTFWENLKGWVGDIVTALQPALDALGTLWDFITKPTVDFNGLLSGIFSGGGSGDTPPKLAGGGHFIVPPGFNNDTFPILTSSGEEVIVLPPGMRGGGGSNSYTYNNAPQYNLTTNTAATSQGVAADFGVLSALYS